MDVDDDADSGDGGGGHAGGGGGGGGHMSRSGWTPAEDEALTVLVRASEASESGDVFLRVLERATRCAAALARRGSRCCSAGAAR